MSELHLRTFFGPHDGSGMRTMTRLVAALIFTVLALSACAGSGYGGPREYYPNGYDSNGLRHGYGNGSFD
jgi:hypothetical protein